MATVLALRVLAHRSRPIAAGAVSGACEAWARRHTECSAHRQQPPLQQQTRCFRSSRSTADDEFYKVLGVPKSASAADIKKAYFAQAKKYHPDQNQGSDDAKKQFQKVTEAYEVLGNTEKRQLYDQYGKAGVDPNNMNQGQGDPFGGFGGGDPFGGFAGNMRGQRIHVDPQDVFGMFEEIFGARGFSQQRQRGPRKGQDLQIGLSISFMEAMFGTKRDVNVTYKGRGRQAQRKTKVVSIELPPGADNGMAFTIQGEGAEGDSKQAPKGDLLVQVTVADDPYFKREGADIHVTTMITLSQALLGGKADVLTLDGMVELTIPAGTTPDTVLMMRQRGVQYFQSDQRGDQYVHVKIYIPKPTELSTAQKKLMEEFRQLEQSETVTHSAFESLGKTMKDAFSRLTRHFSHKDDSAAKDTKDSSSSSNSSSSSSSTSSSSTSSSSGSTESSAKP